MRRAISSCSTRSADGTSMPDPARALARVVRRVHAPTALERCLGEACREPHVVRANRRDAHFANDVVTGFGDEVAGDRRRAGRPAELIGGIVDRRWLERERVAMREPAGHRGLEAPRERRAHVDPAAARAAAQPLVRAAGDDVHVELADVVRVRAGRLVRVEHDQRADLARAAHDRWHVDQHAALVVRVREHHNGGALGDRGADAIGRDRAPVVGRDAHRLARRRAPTRSTRTRATETAALRTRSRCGLAPRSRATTRARTAAR